ncbi:ABC transporter ATP-binding protein [Lactobacillus sp. CC-MHH1034]|uniref:energy-coupling factor ABC transporter ATP-binding protein n=1 Tax=Agrilactobacillus fermenti TaxID=2586909 RepID=UPI001E517427|nr:ABC transporter ATP-binding protein [Agrilactobacillus fermenti]MCD2256029.1 ABC transporter ATP-binding protein [Agrilactobacillus fermenti]
MMTMISLDQVQYQYPGSAMKLTIEQLKIKNALTTIVGANGSGKSTLLKLLLGLYAPSQGTISLEGQDLKALPIKRKLEMIGLVFQNPNDQLFNATVLQEVTWSVRQLGLPVVEQRAKAALTQVGLEAELTTNPYDLSLSKRQLLAIATILAIDPAIYLFDEPFSYLDFPAQQRITALMRQLSETGHQVIVVTHDMDWLATQSDEILLMNQGTIQFQGTPAALFTNHDFMKMGQIAPPRVMQIAQNFGDYEVYLSIEDYLEKIQQKNL